MEKFVKIFFAYLCGAIAVQGLIILRGVGSNFLNGLELINSHSFDDIYYSLLISMVLMLLPFIISITFMCYFGLSKIRYFIIAGFINGILQHLILYYVAYRMNNRPETGTRYANEYDISYLFDQYLHIGYWASLYGIIAGVTYWVILRWLDALPQKKLPHLTERQTNSNGGNA